VNNTMKSNSVLFGEDGIIIQLPYDCVESEMVDENFAQTIFTGIVSIWEYVNGYSNGETRVCWYNEPLFQMQYPSKTYMMYKDLLDFVNQYMRIQLDFKDFVGITHESISKGCYHSDIMFAYYIDIEFEYAYYDNDNNGVI